MRERDRQREKVQHPSAGIRGPLLACVQQQMKVKSVTEQENKLVISLLVSLCMIRAKFPPDLS